jgi:fucose permease
MVPGTAIDTIWTSSRVFFTELFSTEVRYSGASLGYQIGAILGGALAPTIAVMLWNTYGVVYVSVYMPLAAVRTIVCV